MKKDKRLPCLLISDRGKIDSTGQILQRASLNFLIVESLLGCPGS